MIPSLRVVEDIPDWGVLVQVVGGEHHGANVLLVPSPWTAPRPAGREGGEPPRRPIRPGFVTTGGTPDVTADRRAEALLESLLDDEQGAAWRSRRGFWVRTPFGEVELGRVSHLRFNDLDGRRFVLCVLPTRASELPVADVWTNLLLILRGEPRRFFDVANYCVEGGAWRSGPVPLVTKRPARLAR